MSTQLIKEKIERAIAWIERESGTKPKIELMKMYDYCDAHSELKDALALLGGVELTHMSKEKEISCGLCHHDIEREGWTICPRCHHRYEMVGKVIIVSKRRER